MDKGRCSSAAPQTTQPGCGTSALPLAYPRQPNPPRRPTFRDERVRRLAAESIMPDIINWLGDQWREQEREDYVNDLMSVVYENDGFAAANQLKTRFYWEANAELVEILDASWAHAALSTAVHEWVEANGIAPEHQIGEYVKTRHGAGPIVAINATDATYTVQTDEFIRRWPKQMGRVAGYCVAFEDCEAVPQTEPVELSEQSNTDTSTNTSAVTAASPAHPRGR